MINFGEFLQSLSLHQTVLLDRSILSEQKLVKNAMIEKLKCDILGNFQTLCKIHFEDSSFF